MAFKPKIKEKRWDIKIEKTLFEQWRKKKIYSFNINTKKKIFSIDTPPPYPSGRPWHIGAAAHYSQIDMIARTARMFGFEVFFPIGIDRNGVPVERYTEKKYNIKMHETPREKFIELAKTALDDLEAELIEIMKMMGLSGDFENYYRTDSKEYRKLTQETFLMLWKKGLIYQATRPNNYCPDCRTTIADADVVYEELPTQLVYIKFKLVGEDKYITIATTRPELICSCQAILVHPEDERYKDLPGKKALLPLYNREVPILANPAANPEFGSGIVMVCSYGDTTDVRLFRELGLKEIIAINLDGKMNENTGKYVGLEVREARKKIVEDLEALGLIEKKEMIMHRTPVCERSKTPIEIISLDEFYLKQLPFLEDVKKIAEKIIFHPERHRQILYNWINSVSIDWPISRRRYYGTEVPVWYCKKCGKPNLPKPGKYYQPWKEKHPFEKCKYCGGEEFEGETRTFDTWFDSSITPLFISKFLRDEKFFKKTFPNSLRPQAKDIVRTWLYYTLLRCYQLTKKPAWRHAWIMGYGVDEKGERMSKSKGNVIDPIPILKKYGADSFRFWNASEVSLGFDFRCSEERIASASKFLTKLWNIARFISSFPKPKKVKLTKTDEWILAELSKLVKECLKGYEDFNFFIPATKIREFTWNLFASHYMEMVKPRAYGQGFNKKEQLAAWFTLHTCLKNILLLLAPITPFITEKIWLELYGKESIHTQTFPKAEWKIELSKFTKNIVEFNSNVWNLKKEKNLSLKDGIEIEIPKNLKIFEKDLKAMHNIKH
ncbi:MAG: valine--tRNA ligase [Candidatus Aenigmatarchaeota archaeon]